ncbi:L-serine ammonia-lyase, partial [Mesorhizobium sp. M8A.F.Ca.ET.023.01.1.1]
MFLSVFDLFKIGIGPSSSHTMGPMTAARRFLDEVAGDDWPRPAGAKVDRIGASLHGSLAYTGIGHGSDRAVILGLAGQTPQTVDPDQADGIISRITADKLISPPGHPSYHFDPATDLVLDRKTPLTGHANGMAFHAYDAGGR